MNHWMRYLSLALMVTSIAGCCNSSRESPVVRPPNERWEVIITGYDVPQPANVPYDDELGRREFLRFYHQAYLQTMVDRYESRSSIFPMSDHISAATAGHYAGQDDAIRDKEAYWAAQGKRYRYPMGTGHDSFDLKD